jgi:hypothetical protein
LLQASNRTQAIQNVLANDFRGASLQPSESRLLRPKTVLEVRQLSFERQPSLGRKAFEDTLRHYLVDLSKVLTAEFQIRRIEQITGNRLLTYVRYDLVGTGDDFFLEQRTGHWELTWGTTSASQFQLQGWQAVSETRSRSASPIFEDVTRHAPGDNNSSYSTQLMHGVDFWRTVLDGACGIEIYGRNGVSVGYIDGDGFDDPLCLPTCGPSEPALSQSRRRNI